MMIMIMIIARAISWITCRTETCSSSSSHNTVTLSPLSAQATQLTTAARVTVEFCTKFEIETGRRGGMSLFGQRKEHQIVRRCPDFFLSSF